MPTRREPLGRLVTEVTARVVPMANEGSAGFKPALARCMNFSLCLGKAHDPYNG